ncbi:cytidine deaminase [Arthrobacter rhombi]|uniref:cytidine deaminase n=1 Tax=Arthrobacter rhombi TaxID=71253 RepID=UPI0031D27C8C
MHPGPPLIEAAIAQLDRRWPGGDGVAAALALDDGSIVTSVGLDNFNAAVNLCAETGALCQAFTLDRAVTATACVARVGEDIVVLAPCGVCRERLALWGPDVQALVPDRDAPEGWEALSLAELNPHYWAQQFTAGGVWPSAAEHSG